MKRKKKCYILFLFYFYFIIILFYFIFILFYFCFILFYFILFYFYFILFYFIFILFYLFYLFYFILFYFLRFPSFCKFSVCQWNFLNTFNILCMSFENVLWIMFTFWILFITICTLVRIKIELILNFD